ncbi:unnamed protein product [Trifolium pratense]|uniref:Uncharacterized protein n=1 Tax=Trifolium pratense TaxID=57577 RepID=A0ACB0LN27_TRIPR|nr:unnamed protein product [Trifolium pratense]
MYYLHLIFFHFIPTFPIISPLNLYMQQQEAFMEEYNFPTIDKQHLGNKNDTKFPEYVWIVGEFVKIDFAETVNYSFC